ncbi:MAG: hypothetical protein PVG39_31855 [Desulfobacteraceae bacterium]
MIRKKIINLERIRQINGGFSFIPHRFLTDGFFVCLNQPELLLYFFLILVSVIKMVCHIIPMKEPVSFLIWILMST